MGGKKSKIAVQQRDSDVLPESPDTHQNQKPNNAILRVATDQESIALGTFYNARTDCLLKTNVMDISEKSIKTKEYWHSTVVKSGVFHRQKLLDMIDIDPELYLSLTLNMVIATGITSLINFLPFINDHTGILYYRYVSEEKYIANESDYVKKYNPTSIGDIIATHVVTEIKRGIHVVVVYQPSSGNISDIEILLEKIEDQLSKDSFDMAKIESLSRDRFNSIKAFSNIPRIAELTTLTDVCREITKLKPIICEHRPMEYALQSIQYFYPTCLPEKVRYIPLKQENTKQIEEYLNELLILTKPWEILLDTDAEKLLKKHLEQQFDEVQNQISNSQKRYQSLMEKIRNLVVEIRHEKFLPDKLSNILRKDNENKLLLKEINEVTERLTELQDKAQLIHNCREQKIKYSKIENFFIQGEDTMETIEQQLLNKDKYKRIFCCDDKLRRNNLTQWKEFYSELINERGHNPKLDLVYADFSYCSCHLEKMKILIPNDIKERTQSSWTSPKSQDLGAHIPSTIKYINVLLLGESGVGKSTFINALVNYLKFETIKDAHSGQPIVLMPVSFLMTTGDQFEERFVRFGEVDPNEDLNQLGQSVTQHCRSYVL